MITPKIPQSFVQAGYLTAEQVRKTRRLMLGTDGIPDSGKTEFVLSAPGPGIVLALDRGFDAVLDNQTPPPTRRDDWVFKVITVPKATSVTQNEALEYWRAFYNELKKALDNREARTVVLDGDSDSWELQRLAGFGKLTQIPPILYTEVNAARRAMIARCYDSGKIVIATNKSKRAYKDAWNADGTPKLDNSNKQVREWDGVTYEREGFRDHDYLWQLQIRHLYHERKGWGLKITKCKVNKELEGMELWGVDCHFAALVETVYPHIPLADWGY